MPNKDYAEVGVREAARDDAGRGIARVSIDIMRALGLVSGDVIEIQGKKKAELLLVYFPLCPRSHCCILSHISKY